MRLDRFDHVTGCQSNFHFSRLGEHDLAGGDEDDPDQTNNQLMRDRAIEDENLLLNDLLENLRVLAVLIHQFQNQFQSCDAILLDVELADMDEILRDLNRREILQ